MMDGNGSGAVATPPEWPPRTVVCVGAVVLRGEQVLFVRQAQGHSLAGQWSIPWGFVDAGEPPEVAAVRETREESGVEARVEGLLGVQNLPESGWLGIVFLCRHLSGEPVPDGVETDRAAYFDLLAMEALGEPFEPWCAWLARRVLRGKARSIPLCPDNPYRPRMAFF